jgi:tetratricopeptide (TPR) repeat protein
MNWRQLLTSSLVTLIVTILGGAVVYRLTREEPPKPPEAPNPKLYYELSPPASFITEKAKTAIYAIKIWNGGQKEAEGVRLAVSFPEGSQLVDKKIEPSEGQAIDYTFTQQNSNHLLLELPSLNPRESCRATFLIQGPSEEKATISLRAKGVVGEEIKGLTNPSALPAAESHTPSDFLGSLLAAGVTLQFGLIYVLILVRRSLPSDRMNNLGFRYLHKGRVDEAIQYLRKSIDIAPNAYNLSNLGQAQAVSGDVGSGIVQCEVALEYTRRKHDRMVVMYNLACIHMVGSRVAEGLGYLEQALKLEAKVVRSYLEMNVNIAGFRSTEEVRSLLAKYP